MSGWLSLLPVVACLIVLLPGAAVGAALRLRGVLLWGFAPAAGVAAVALSATVLGLAGIEWAWWSALGGVLVLAAIAYALGRLLGPTQWERRPSRPWRNWTFVGAIALGALLGPARMASLIGDPRNLSQTNDATFHLNALRFVAESGSASSLDLLGTIDASGFYPAAWHSVASLVMGLTGTDAVLAANATSLAIAGPLWTLSITSLVWSVTRGSLPAAVSAAVMSPALFAFPFDMLDFGVLYPYALALAVLPGVLSLLVLALSPSQAETPSRSRHVWLVITASGVGIVALGLAQPSAVLVWLIGAVCAGLGRLAQGWRTADRPGRIRRMLGAAALLIVASALWLVVTRFSSSALWGPRKPIGAATVDIVLNAGAGPVPIILMSLLSVVGFVISVRVPRLRWLALLAVAITLLTLVALSVQNVTVRGLLAAWYADPHRFVAMMPLIVIPLAAIAVDAIFATVRRARPRGAVVVAGLLLVAVVAEAAIGVAIAVERHWGSYRSTPTSYLSSDEETLLEDLNTYVDRGDRVLGNPSAGAAFGYALSGIDVVPRTWSMPGDEDFQELRWNLTDISRDPAVCSAVRRMDVDYVLDFGQSSNGAGKWEMPGLTGFEDHPGFQFVAERGEASLWRIEPCALD
ncbi:DUF6541 family protein [Microbacterium sp. NPDC058342]|uniref:DUF6541 family protein n=1 Tax=Microbacterium sp. NPDC058342 TaxID=3346454 RepID=UPI003663B021